ncbi:hypothetical protein G7Y89_g12283 [Cudoniella acicularis]|uniref:Peptide N-acetyl-beta-D-glucosaminyl asparaginase amidase A N-terminal domain-containing protein n=1 Tax=Cudoniella acicularis TaxID=354080 RepID=A0A8H4RC51_9HELO|nr:hypothetical protein G7Y89_g12283 [Cudoniella acicularis]
MGGNNGGTRQRPSHGTTTVTQALEIARDSEEGAQDPAIVNILETAVSAIWVKIQAQPTSYVMTRNEFAVFNYFQRRFEGQEVATAAKKRTANIRIIYSTFIISGTELAKMDDFGEPKDSGREGKGKGTMPPLSSRKDAISKKELWSLEMGETKPGQNSSGLSWPKLLLLTFIGCCVAVIWLFGDYSASEYDDAVEIPSGKYNLVKDAVPVARATSSTPVLECFQVYQPVLFPSGAVDSTISGDGTDDTTTIASTEAASSCEVLLMEHSFGFSYGIPFVGNYTPPKCKFNRVVMNFTVTSKGRQYDRLAIMYFNDTEVWRTSTAEPTANGIRWEYVKDMTEYLYFWNSPQTLIFDLGNLVNDIYTGSFNTTLTVTFFTSEETVEPASLIIPISARKGSTNSPSIFTLPSDNATNTISFPRNANRAVFSVSACGQATEEFWWSNSLQSDINAFIPVDGVLYGYSPFREVQVLIDGQLAGVQWPFPVIFTGGVVPGLWRPIVGIDAFDLREHEIDITPWLPVLCDGRQHSFEIRVAGIVDDGKTSGTLTETVGSSCSCNHALAKTHTKLHRRERDPRIHHQRPAPTLHLLPPHHPKRNRLVTWTQTLSTTNYGLYTDFGAVQQNNQSTIGTDQSTGGIPYSTSYSYPLYANTTYLVQPSGNFTIDASVIRGLDLTVSGTPVFPSGLQPFTLIPSTSSLASSFSGTALHTTQNGTAHYFGSPSAGTSSGFGSTSQDFSFWGLGTGERELYGRSVEAVNGSVVKDSESLVGVQVGSYGVDVGEIPKVQVVVGGVVSPKEAIGRGILEI